MNVFVTSFSKAGYQQYGKRFLAGFIEHFPADARLFVFYESEQPEERDPRISYFDLDRDHERGVFIANNQDRPAANYRFEAARFSHKVFAFTRTDLIPANCDRWIWIDADVVVNKATPPFTFDDSTLAAYLGRTDWDHSECGFVAYNMLHPHAVSFLEEFRRLYTSEKLFDLKEWHDSFLFDHLRQQAFGFCKFENLTPDAKGLNVFEQSFLGDSMRHLKGSQKDEIRLDTLFVGCKNRYEQLSRLIAALKPRSIVEIGTWNGDRALSMATEALKHRDTVTYHGIDLFEDADATTDSEEFNVKKHHDLSSVSAKLTAFQAANPGFDFVIDKGNSRDIAKPLFADKDIDFAFIDGGHSLDTIENDFAAVKHAKLVVLDDFYIAGADTAKVGCNAVLKNVPHIVLPVVDQFQDGLRIAMAVVGSAISGKPPQTQQQFQVKTKNCVPDEQIHDNVRYALMVAKPKWLPQVCQPIKDTAILVGGSPSLKGQIWYIRRLAKRHKVYCVKSSLDLLLKHNIPVEACILLDPRKHVSEFVPDARPGVKYLVASMCHKSTWDALKDADVWGYHASVHAGEEKVIAECGGGNLVMGGTTSAMRGMNLLYMMGYRRFRLFALDSSYKVMPKATHGVAKPPAMSVDVHGRSFITDPELVAQSKDFETFIKMLPDVAITVYGDGLLNWVKYLLDQHDRSTRKSINPCLFIYVKAFEQENDALEALFVSNAARAIRRRSEALVSALARLPVFKDVVAHR